jgi:vanillate O-demethylase monooxygenase subunit
LERHRGVWIWLGDPDRADASLIPDYSIVDSAPDTAVVQDYLRAEANYQLLTDNILDLTHADYVHAGSLGNGGVTKTLPKIWDEGDAVFVHWWIVGDKGVPALAHELPDPEAPTDQWLEVKWNAPASMSLRVGATLTGRPREEGIDSTSLHIMTPETATTTHYFFANARQFRVDDPAVNEVLKGIIANQFLGEDKPILEAQQKLMGTADLFGLKPLFLPQDAAAVRVRRKIEAMYAEENQ